VAYEADQRLVPARWIECSDREEPSRSTDKAYENLPIDGGGHLNFTWRPTPGQSGLIGNERLADVKFRVAPASIIGYLRIRQE